MAKGVSFSSDTRFKSKLIGAQQADEASSGSQSDDESSESDGEEAGEGGEGAAAPPSPSGAGGAAGREPKSGQAKAKAKTKGSKKKAKGQLRPSRQHHQHRTQRSFSLVPERLGRGLAGSLQSQRHMQVCEVVLKTLIIALIAVTFPFSFIVCLKVIAQYERAAYEKGPPQSDNGGSPVREIGEESKTSFGSGC